MTDKAAPAAARNITPILIPLALGAAVAVTLGVYGQVHDPTGRTLYTLFFSETVRLKNWLTTLAVILAISQVLSASWMWGRLPGAPSAPGWLGSTHKLLGTLTFAATLPVVYHCLWALGYQSYTTRVAVHSLLGCALYGAFVAKVTAVRRHDLPGWALPLIGSLVFVLLVVVWWTSARWYFTNISWGI